jgi:hypothetical protein
LKPFLLGFALVLCSCSTASVAPAHATPKGVVLQTQDVPVLKQCPQSERWAVLMLNGEPEMLPVGMANWSDLQAGGATDAWMSLYADNVSECLLLFGSGGTPKGKLVYTAAIKFKDSASAAADFASDSQNFPVAPSFAGRFTAAGGRLIRGAGTGLGESSVAATITLGGAPRYAVLWQLKNFEAVVYASNISAAEGSADAVLMNGRIH